MTAEHHVAVVEVECVADDAVGKRSINRTNPNIVPDDGRRSGRHGLADCRVTMRETGSFAPATALAVKSTSASFAMSRAATGMDSVGHRRDKRCGVHQSVHVCASAWMPIAPASASCVISASFSPKRKQDLARVLTDEFRIGRADRAGRLAQARRDRDGLHLPSVGEDGSRRSTRGALICSSSTTSLVGVDRRADADRCSSQSRSHSSEVRVLEDRTR